MSNSPKTLLVITPSLHVGGTETHLLQILPGLKEKGWNINLFLTSALGPIAEPLATAGINIIEPSKLSCKLHNKSKILRAPILLLTFIRLIAYLFTHRPNVTMLMLPEAYLIGGLGCVLTLQNNLVMNRRSLNAYQEKYGLISKIEHWLHSKMSKIITNSQANVQQLIEQEKVPQDKIQLIYNGINVARYALIDKFDQLEIKYQFKLPDSSYVMIVIANLIPYKGHITLLKALAQIQTQLPEDWQLLCLGQKHQPYAHELSELTTLLNLTSHIHWLGSQREILKLLAIADVAISCSYEEGFSNSVLECMAAGLPLIVTNVGGNPEAVVNDVTGLVVAPQNADQLCTAILQLANNQAQREAMGKAGKERVAADFSLSHCINQYYELFSKF